MKSMSVRALCAIVLVCGLAACDKSSSSSSTETATATSATASATTQQAPVTIADSDLVTPADMEPQAESTITSANYKAQLASLETEMSKE